MNIPGFNAEFCLGPASPIYRAKKMFGGSQGEVLMQQLSATPFLGRLDLTMRCCGYSTLLRRFVCTTRSVSPLEHCECRRDYFGHPLIICRPPVATF